MSGPNLYQKQNNLRIEKKEDSAKGLLSLIQLKEFRKLWLGQIFSQLSDKFYIVLTVHLIAQYWVNSIPQSNEALVEVATAMRMDLVNRTQVITLLATGIYIANTIPAILLGTVAGVWADRWPKRRIMVASNAFRAALVLTMPLCLIPGPSPLGISWGYWLLLLITLFESVLTQFFAPAEQAAIPLLVPKGNLLAANSLYQATNMGATILGFALGEPILRLLHKVFLQIGTQGGEFILLPFCYGIAAVFIGTIKLKESCLIKNKNSLWDEIAEGFEILHKKPKIRGAMIQLVLLYSILATLYVLAIGLASYIESLGPTRFGILLALTGVGMAVCAVGLAQKGHDFHRKKLSTFGLGSISCCLVLLGQARGNLLLTLLLCCFLGFGAALVAIPAQTTLQEETPASKRGKIFGLQNNLINIALSLPLVIAGVLISSLGLIPILWCLAALTALSIFIERPWQHC